MTGSLGNGRKAQEEDEVNAGVVDHAAESPLNVQPESRMPRRKRSKVRRGRLVRSAIALKVGARGAPPSRSELCLCAGRLPRAKLRFATVGFRGKRSGIPRLRATATCSFRSVAERDGARCETAESQIASNSKLLEHEFVDELRQIASNCVNDEFVEFVDEFIFKLRQTTNSSNSKLMEHDPTIDGPSAHAVQLAD